MKTVIAIIVIVLSALVAVAQDKPLEVLEQPKPGLPENYGLLDVQGTVRLKVEFLSSGKVGNIVEITKIPVANLTQLAVEAARKIKFEPEVRDGSRVDTTRLIQYGYSWNGFWQTPLLIPNNDQLLKQSTDPQAESIVQRAVQNLGGNSYLKVYSQIGKGRFSVLKDGVNVSFQSFVDVIVFPDKERTEFKALGIKTIQTNTGSAGWVFDGDQELIKVQTEKQVANFKRGIRTSLDNLLRGYWKGDAELSYVGRRPGTLGRRNDVVKLTYKDGFTVEFEFSADDGTPVKAIYKTTNADGEMITEEDRYAQFIETQGIKAPYIVDRFTNGQHASRINFETIEYNKSISDSIFTKPSDPKSLKKDLRL